MPAECELLRTQRWLQAFIVSPEEADEEALRSVPVASEFEGDVSQMVTPSRTLTALERAGVYRGMYLQRMQEALESDYLVVRDWLGEEQFARLVRGYVREYPSRSYTLNRLGDHMPEYVEGLPAFPHQSLLHDLVRFELAVTEVFDEEETPSLTPEAIEGVPEDAWEAARLRPVAAFRLVRFDYPVDRFKEAYRDGLDYPAPVPDQTNLAVYRRNYKVFWLALAEPAFRLLGALAEGTPLGEALAESDADDEALFDWFQDWLRAGLFQSVEIEAL